MIEHDQLLDITSNLHNLRVHFLLTSVGVAIFFVCFDRGGGWVDSAAPSAEQRSTTDCAPSFDDFVVDTPPPSLQFKLMLVWGFWRKAEIKKRIKILNMK